jgi:hypothetical protein
LGVVVAVDGDSFGTQEGERPPLEAVSQRLVRDSKPRELSVCTEPSSVRNTDTLCLIVIALYVDCKCVNW